MTSVVLPTVLGLVTHNPNARPVSHVRLVVAANMVIVASMTRTVERETASTTAMRSQSAEVSSALNRISTDQRGEWMTQLTLILFCAEYAPTGQSTCPLNVCCSQYGFCGTAELFCDSKCPNGCITPSQP